MFFANNFGVISGFIDGIGPVLSNIGMGLKRVVQWSKHIALMCICFVINEMMLLLILTN